MLAAQAIDERRCKEPSMAAAWIRGVFSRSAARRRSAQRVSAAHAPLP